MDQMEDEQLPPVDDDGGIRSVNRVHYALFSSVFCSPLSELTPQLPSLLACGADSESEAVDGEPRELPIKNRILYDVFFHEPAWPSITDAAPPSAASSSLSAVGGLSSDAGEADERYYEVSEADYLTQRLNSYAQSLTTREQLRRRFLCWQRRKPRDQQQLHDINDVNADDSDNGSQGTAVREELDDDSAAAQSGIHWPILLSASTHLLALLTESSIVLRSALTQYAFVDLASIAIPPYIHSRSPYAASQPSAHLFSSSLHPFSYMHNRPAAWYRDDMLAVAVKDDTVSVYDVEPITVDKDMPRSAIRHTFSFSLASSSSPLEPSSAASLSLVARVAGGRRKQYPTIAGMVWRDAVCHRNVKGTCPHLIVLTYDGQLHHVHIPAQLPSSSAASSSASRLSWVARVPPHAPPTASHSRSSSIVMASTAAASLSSASPKKGELGHHSRAVTSVIGGATEALVHAAGKEEAKRTEVQMWMGVRQQHGTLQQQPREEEEQDEEDDEEERLKRLKDSGGIKRRRKQPTSSTSDSSSATPDSTADADSQAPIPLAFTSMAYHADTQMLVIAATTLTSDRCPQLSFWSVKDQTSQPFILRHTTTLVQTAHHEERRQRRTAFAHTVQRVWKRVKVNVGLEIADDGDRGKGSDSDANKGGYEPTLSDITMSMMWSPNGRRLLLLDVLGNMNVWQISAEQPVDVALIETVRSGEESRRGSRGVLLCQAGWWSDDVLVKGYTNGHITLTALSPHSTVSSSVASLPLSSAAASSSSTSLNLLGQPEQVDGIPILSASAAAHLFTPPLPSLPAVPLPHRLFVLSCSHRYLRKRRLWSQLSTSGSSDDSVDDDGVYESEDVSVASEFRLLSVSESKADEFMRRKVELGHWTEAEQVCEVYGLNEDELWKERWKRAEVSETNVRELLSKVTDRWWVLQQCATRTSDDKQKRRLLLKHGLSLTSFRILSSLSTSTSLSSRGGHLFSSPMPNEGSVGEEVDPSTLSSLILSPGQLRLCLYRLLFQSYLRRLDTFDLLQQSSTEQSSLYPLSATSYTFFLTCDLLSAACDLARDENFIAVALLLERHSIELWTKREAIVAEVPLTCDPASYEPLLPLSIQTVPSGNGSADGWVLHPTILRQMEQYAVQSQAPADLPILVQHIRMLLLHQQALATYQPSVPALVDWYIDRMQRMDEQTGDLQQVHSMCLLVAEKDKAVAAGLSEWRRALDSVMVLVYEWEMDVSVREWLSMSDMERLKRVMRGSKEADIAADINAKAALVLRDKGEEAEALLLRYVQEEAMHDLSLVRGMVRGLPALSRLLSHRDQFVEAVLSALYSSQAQSASQLQTVDDVLIALPEATSEAIRARVAACRQHVRAGRLLDKYHVAQPPSFFLSLLPSSAEMAVEGTAAADERVKRVREESVRLFNHLCRRAIRVKPTYGDKQWSELLTDLLTLQQLVLTSVPLHTAYTYYIEALLAAGRFKLAKRMLRELTGIDKREEQHQPPPSSASSKQSSHGSVSLAAATFAPSLTAAVLHVGILPLPTAEALVLQVAREFIDSAASIDHPALEQATECLELLPLQSNSSFFLSALMPSTTTSSAAAADSASSAASTSASSSSSSSLANPELTAQWQQDLNFLQALRRLSVLGVQLIPYQLRTSTSRLAFLSLLLQHNPAAYKDEEEVLDIARLLNVSTEEEEGEVRLALLNAALDDGEVERAYQVAIELLEKNRWRGGWKGGVAVERALRGVKGKKAARRRLISHAVWACEVSEIDEVLDDWRNVSFRKEDVDGYVKRWKEVEAQWSIENGQEAAAQDSSAMQDIDVGSGAAAFGMNELDNLLDSVMEPDHAAPAPPFASSVPLPSSSLASYVHHHAQDVSVQDALLLSHAASSIVSEPSLALSYLLALSSPLVAESLFRHLLAGSLHRVLREAVVSVAFRHYALAAISASHPFPLPQEMHVLAGESGLLHVSDDLLQQQVDAIARLYHGQPASTAALPADVQSALRYGGLRAEARKADFARSKLPGLDVDRFSVDSEYRLASILSLTHSADVAQIDTALAMAKRYGLQPSAVYIERLKYLLLSTDTSVKQVKAEVAQWSQQLMMQPAETYAVLSTVVYPAIPGQQLERLHYLITLCDDCFSAFEAIAKSYPSSSRVATAVFTARQLLTTHTRVLDTLMKAHIALDYHRLTGRADTVSKSMDRFAVLNVLSDVVEEENVLLLARLAGRLSELVDVDDKLPTFPALPSPSSPTSASPSSPSQSRAATEPTITSSLIFRLFLCKTFDSPASAATSPSDWLERYNKYFQRCSAVDAYRFLEYASRLPVEGVPSTEAIMRRLTVLDVGLMSVDKMGGLDEGVARLHDALLVRHEHLSALVSIMQLPSIVASPSFAAMIDISTLRSAVRHLLLHTAERQVKVSDVLEMLDVLTDERTKHVERYKLPIPASYDKPFTLPVLMRELVQGCCLELKELQWTGLPQSLTFDCLLSPSVLLSLCGGADVLRQLHGTLVLYSSAVRAGELDWSKDVVEPLRAASSWSDYVGQPMQAPGPIPLAPLSVELLWLALSSGASHSSFPHSHLTYTHDLQVELAALLMKEEKDCKAAVAFLHQLLLEECIKRSRDEQQANVDGRPLTPPQSEAIDRLISVAQLSQLLAGHETALLDENTTLLVAAFLCVKQRRQKVPQSEASTWWTAMAQMVHSLCHTPRFLSFTFRAAHSVVAHW